MQASQEELKIGIFLFPDIETLDFCGPLEVFTAANIATGENHFDVYTFAENTMPIKTINGLSVNPDFDIDAVPQPDILILPGGDGTKAVIANPGLLQKLNALQEQTRHTFSVCSGARIPAVLGLLDGKKFTTHHSVFEDILKLAPKARVRPNNRYTDNGKILTSAGVAAGIDLSFYLLEKLKGKEVMDITARYMEYPVKL